MIHAPGTVPRFFGPVGMVQLFPIIPIMAKRPPARVGPPWNPPVVFPGFRRVCPPRDWSPLAPPNEVGNRPHAPRNSPPGSSARPRRPPVFNDRGIARPIGTKLPWGPRGPQCTKLWARRLLSSPKKHLLNHQTIARLSFSAQGKKNFRVPTIFLSPLPRTTRASEVPDGRSPRNWPFPPRREEIPPQTPGPGSRFAPRRHRGPPPVSHTGWPFFPPRIRFCGPEILPAGWQRWEKCQPGKVFPRNIAPWPIGARKPSSR